MYAAGTTRACPPSRASAGSATRRRRSAPSARASASPRPTGIDRARAAGALRARRPQPARPACDGRAAAAQGGDRQLPRGPGGRAGGGQQSRRCRGGDAQGAVLTGALHRAGRFPRGSAQAVLPPLAGARSAAALRLFHHLHRRGEGRGRQRGGGALHLRPGHARRQRARRPQGEIDDSLGVGGARARCRSAAVRPAVRQGESQRSGGRARLHWTT